MRRRRRHLDRGRRGPRRIGVRRRRHGHRPVLLLLLLLLIVPHAYQMSQGGLVPFEPYVDLVPHGITGEGRVSFEQDKVYLGIHLRSSAHRPRHL